MKHQERNDYILGVGDTGANRLRLLHQVYGSGTQRLLSEVGLAPGMHVADIGCGVGTVSLWMAEQVGPGGSIVCIDRSAQQLELARRSAHEAGHHHITFIEASADNINLPAETFDLVYCRFLLDHLENPSAALTEMRRLLKPQGALITETLDLSGLATDPSDSVYAEEADCMRRLSAMRGIDACNGMAIHRLVRDAGFTQIQVSLNQPAYLRGEEKRFWEYSVAETASALVARGLCTMEELQRRIQGMQRVNADENILVALPRSVQVWAIK